MTALAQLPGEVICPGTGIRCGGFGAGDRLLGGDLRLIAQLDRFVLDQGARLFPRLGSEQQSDYGSREPANNEAHEKGAKLITVRHGNLLLVIKRFGIVNVKFNPNFTESSFKDDLCKICRLIRLAPARHCLFLLYAH